MNKFTDIYHCMRINKNIGPANVINNRMKFLLIKNMYSTVIITFKIT